jgi:hypothetical protein
MRWLGYAWTVAVNCFYLVIIGWVFTKLGNRHEEVITVAVLGLIYVAIRTISMYQFAATFEMFMQTRKQLLQLQQFVRDPSYARNQQEWDEAEKLKQKSLVKFYINGFFLWLIGMFCLFALFATLTDLPAPY